MALGMTYDEYWYGEVTATRMYFEADRLRQKRYDEEAWLQGMYIYDALTKASPLFRAFAPRGTRASPYPKSPYGMGNKKQNESAKKQEEENERLKAILFFKNWARAAAKHFEN